MAGRQNDGLNIALIIFVMLTILLVVCTYFEFTKLNEAMQKNDALTKTATDATTDKTKAETGLATLKQLIGVAPTDDPDQIAKDGKDDINKQQQFVSTKLPEEQRTLKKLIESMTATITSKNDLLSTADAHTKQLDSEKLAIQNKADAKEQELEKALKTAQDDLDAERTKYNQAVEALNKTSAGLVQDKNDKNKAFDEMKASYERKLAELTSDQQKAQKELLQIKKILATYSGSGGIASSGGWVTGVDQRNDIAYINLGSDDGLRRRITFSVYPPDTTDISKAIPKGKVEVINVSGSHTAEVRITDNPLGDPILPGDLVHTIGWHPGQHEHFAICGFIDIDGSGTAETRKLHDLIVANGGIVDAEIDDKGKIVGALTVNTRFLIVGELIPDKLAANIYIAPSTKMFDDAKRLGVEQIGVLKFLGMMGYTPRSAIGTGYNVPGAAAGKGSDRGANEKPAGDNGGFRPRKPPADNDAG